MATIQKSGVRKAKPVVRVIGWDTDRLKKYGAAIRAAGFEADTTPFSASGMIGKMARMNPLAIVMDSTSRYSDVRIMASLLRQSRSARHIPIVLAGGEGEKLATTRAKLPDATYCAWDEVTKALKKIAASGAPRRVVVPEVAFSGASLGKKLGIGAEMRVALVHAPEGFVDWLGELPEAATLHQQDNFELHPSTRLAIVFLHSVQEAEVAALRLAAKLPEGAQCWAINPKQTAKIRAGFNQNHVRAAFRAAGMMDYKVCSVSAEWSGLKFSRKGKAK